MGEEEFEIVGETVGEALRGESGNGIHEFTMRWAATTKGGWFICRGKGGRDLPFDYIRDELPYPYTLIHLY